MDGDPGQASVQGTFLAQEARDLAGATCSHLLGEHT